MKSFSKKCENGLPAPGLDRLIEGRWRAAPKWQESKDDQLELIASRDTEPGQ